MGAQANAKRKRSHPARRAWAVTGAASVYTAAVLTSVMAIGAHNGGQPGDTGADTATAGAGPALHPSGRRRRPRLAPSTTTSPAAKAHPARRCQHPKASNRPRSGRRRPSARRWLRRRRASDDCGVAPGDGDKCVPDRRQRRAPPATAPPTTAPPTTAPPTTAPPTTAPRLRRPRRPRRPCRRRRPRRRRP